MTLKFHTMGNILVLKCSLQVPDIFSLDSGFVFEKSEYSEKGSRCSYSCRSMWHFVCRMNFCHYYFHQTLPSHLYPFYKHFWVPNICQETICKYNYIPSSGISRLSHRLHKVFKSEGHVIQNCYQLRAFLKFFQLAWTWVGQCTMRADIFLPENQTLSVHWC